MLFHTWTFAVFFLIVLPVFLALRHTPFWMVWLLAASYVFYGWWNPYYLILIFYSTALDFILVALMDHCPPGKGELHWRERLRHFRSADMILKATFVVAAVLSLALVILALAGPRTLRPTAA